MPFISRRRFIMSHDVVSEIGRVCVPTNNWQHSIKHVMGRRLITDQPKIVLLQHNANYLYIQPVTITKRHCL